ncbi:hypothetical protein EDB89DRAFT_841245 [Lactarius sanguifluus]|nr:hypothetical protein EDB89DRAFT_841245 [Lactarius sanguifluus]
MLYLLSSSTLSLPLTQIPKTQIAAGQWRPRHRLRNGLLPPPSHLVVCEHPTRLTCCTHPSTCRSRMCTQAIPLLPSRGTWPHSDEFYFFTFCFFLTHFDRAGPPAPSPQPQHHRTRTRCPSTLTPPPRYCCDTPTDPATTTTSTPPRRCHLDLATSIRPPPPPRPRYETSTSAAHLDPHWRHLDTASTTTSTPASLPPTRLPSIFVQ